MSQTNTARYKYTPDEMSQEAFLERFVVRQEVFEEIFEELVEADYSVPNQHYIMIGQRGQGKTTLLRKLKIEVEKHKKLSKFLLPVKFNEEQYRVRQLCRFWEEVADYLQAHYEEMFDGILEGMEKHIDDDNYPVKCFSYLEKQLKKKKKKLLILVDNIDEFLAKIKPEEQHQLREILLTSSSFIIVGGSTKMFEQQYDYSKPFYEFFKIIRLEELSFNESVALLRVLGDEEQLKKIDYIIEHTPQRIETLRRVTGGVPRTIVMLFDIFVEDNGNAFDDLMKILDEVTPLYKDRMDDLPPVLQEIVDTIALNWDGMSTKEIAKKTRMESKTVSAQMKQLEKYQIVDSDAVGKNKIYIIKERFFNIWYLMRFGRKKDRTRVEWLVKFLLSWYSPKELEEKAKSFRSRLVHGDKLDVNYVYMMGEALSYTGSLALEEEHKLKESARNYLKGHQPSYVKDMSKSDKELLDEAFDFERNNKRSKALEILLVSKRKSAAVLGNIGLLYHENGDKDNAEKYYIQAIEKDDINSLNNLGNLYGDQKEYEKAEECYLRAIDGGTTDPLSNLGVLYAQQKMYDKAEEYFLKAIEGGDTGALRNLGIAYAEQKMYDKAEEYFLKAIESGDTDALRSLGSVYAEQKIYDKAGEYYLKAIESGDMGALRNLGIVYAEQKIYDKAEEYYLKAIESGDTGASGLLSWFYYERNMKSDKALEYIAKDYNEERDDLNTYIYAVILLWQEMFEESYEKFMEWLTYTCEAEEERLYAADYFMLLMAKGQYYQAKVFFELPEYQLKERYKPLWYALMTLMQDEFPVEIKKMGSELKQTVDEVLAEVERMRERYGSI